MLLIEQKQHLEEDPSSKNSGGSLLPQTSINNYLDKTVMINGLQVFKQDKVKTSEACLNFSEGEEKLL